MAINGDAIRTAVRELLEGTIGSIRTCSGQSFKAADNADRAAISQLLGTRTAGCRFAVDLGSPTDHEDGLSELSNIALRRIEIAVTTWHRLKHPRHKSSTRDDALGDVIADIELMREALCWPGNLDATNASVATNIIPGTVEHIGGSPPRIVAIAEHHMAEAVNRYSATLLITTPIS